MKNNKVVDINDRRAEVAIRKYLSNLSDKEKEQIRKELEAEED